VAQLLQHSVHIQNHICFNPPFPLPSDHPSAVDSFATLALYKFTYLLTKCTSAAMRVVTAGVYNSCESGIRVLNYCLEWDKFVNTDLSHSRQ